MTTDDMVLVPMEGSDAEELARRHGMFVHISSDHVRQVLDGYHDAETSRVGLVAVLTRSIRQALGISVFRCDDCLRYLPITERQRDEVDAVCVDCAGHDAHPIDGSQP